MELEQVIKDGVQSGDAIAVAALVVWLLTAYFKSDKFPIDVPPRVRPFLALGLAQSYASLAAIVGGKPVADSVIDGLLVGAVAIASQEAGKPLSGPVQSAVAAVGEFLKGLFKKGGAGMSVFLLFVLSSCVDKSKIEAGLNGAVEFHDRAAPCLMSMYANDLANCAGNDACMAQVHDVYGKAIDGSNAFRMLICAIDKSAEGCSDE